MIYSIPLILLLSLLALAYCAAKAVADLRAKRFAYAAWGAASCVGILLATHLLLLVANLDI